jgi:hypothetical protein
MVFQVLVTVRLKPQLWFSCIPQLLVKAMSEKMCLWIRSLFNNLTRVSDSDDIFVTCIYLVMVSKFSGMSKWRDLFLFSCCGSIIVII